MKDKKTKQIDDIREDPFEEYIKLGEPDKADKGIDESLSSFNGYSNRFAHHIAWDLSLSIHCFIISKSLSESYFLSSMCIPCSLSRFHSIISVYGLK